MPDALYTIRPEATGGGFRVAGPRPGDRISGALRSAYGRKDRLPEEIGALLARLDRIDCRER